MENKYLNEEKYQKTSRKISLLGKIVICIGISIIGLLLFLGFNEKNKVKEMYSKENIESQIEIKNEELVVLEENLKESEKKLTDKKVELEASIKDEENEIKQLERVPFSGHNDAYYQRQDRIEELKKQIQPTKDNISIIEKYFSNSSHCSFYASFEANTKILDEVCDNKGKVNAKEFEIDKLKNMDLEREIRWNDNSSTYFMFIPFVAILTLGLGVGILTAAKRREIMAYSIQGVMPIAQEGLETIAPTVGKVGKAIAKEMAPVYGDIAKEISKGIKDGLNDEEK